jgi:hypothetical protein
MRPASTGLPAVGQLGEALKKRIKKCAFQNQNSLSFVRVAIQSVREFTRRRALAVRQNCSVLSTKMNSEKSRQNFHASEIPERS